MAIGTCGVSCASMCNSYFYHPTGMRNPRTYIHGVGNYSNDGIFLRGTVAEYRAVLVGPNAAQAKDSCCLNSVCGCSSV